MVNKIAVVAGVLVLLGLLVLGYYTSTAVRSESQYLSSAGAPANKAVQETAGATSGDREVVDNISQTAKQTVPSGLPVGWE